MRLPDPKSLRIVLYPDPVLKRPAAPLTNIGPEWSAIAARMFELMREAKGLGLAAPQVGISARLFVCNATGESADDLVIVNPKITDTGGAVEHEEGCLSIPGVTVTMRRAAEVVVEAQHLDGKPLRIQASELLARIFQHETDHLNGTLIIDRMSEADAIANRRAIKQLEEDARGRRRN